MTIYELIKQVLSYNQGVVGTPVHLKKIKYLIFTPLAYYLTPDILASSSALKAQLIADNENDDPAQRIQITPMFGEAKDDSEAAKSQSFNYGLSRMLGFGGYVWTFFPWTDNLMVIDKLQKFNGHADDFRVILVDADWNIAGTITSNSSDGSAVLQGYSLMDIFTGQIQLDTGEGTKNGIRLALADTAEMNMGNRAIFPAGFNVGNTLKNINDVIPVITGALSSGVISIAPMMNNQNLANSFSTALTTSTTWIIKNATTGATLTATSFTPATVNGNKSVTITIPTTGSYPTSGQYLSITMAAPSVVAANGIKRAEMPIPILIKIP